jgi:DNA-binding CsgD family transcriptional regulator
MQKTKSLRSPQPQRGVYKTLSFGEGLGEALRPFGAGGFGFFFLFFFFLSFGVGGFAQTFVLKKGQASHELTPKAQVLYDTAGKFEIRDILTPPQQARFRQGTTLVQTVKTHWYKIEIDNQSQEVNFYIEVFNILHSELYVVYEGKGGRVEGEKGERTADSPLGLGASDSIPPSGIRGLASLKNGLTIPVAQRAYLGKLSQYPLTLPAGKATLYLAYKGLNECVECLGKKRFVLYRERYVFWSYMERQIIAISVLSLLLAMTFYNAFLFFIVRDRSYAYYVLSVAFVFMYVFLGEDYPKFWIDVSLTYFKNWQTFYNNLTIALAYISFFQFTRTYLQTRLAYPRWDKVLRMYQYVMTVVLIALVTITQMIWGTQNNTQAYLSNAVMLLGMGLLLTLTVWVGKVRKNGLIDVYYGYSNGVLIVFAIGGLLTDLSVLPAYTLTRYVYQMGIVSQVIAFSMALAGRITLLRKEIAEKRLENERMEKRITEQKNIELEQKVKERTRDLQQSNEEIRAQADHIEKQAKLLEDQKNRELLNRTLQILQKNELLPTVSKFLETHIDLFDEQARRENRAIQKEIQNNLASDTNWESLKMHFEEVHPTLFAELQKLNPDLTKNDLRYCAYLKMGLSNKDIAQLLHLDTDSVRKQQYRIKQKLGLEKDISLNDFVKSVGGANDLSKRDTTILNDSGKN